LEVDTFPPFWDPLLLRQLTNLTSLRIPYNQRAFNILAAVGSKLKQLSFMEEVVQVREWSTEKHLEKLLNVFLLCPELEILEVLYLKGEVDLSVSVQVDSLKLKNCALTI